MSRKLLFEILNFTLGRTTTFSADTKILSQPLPVGALSISLFTGAKRQDDKWIESAKTDWKIRDLIDRQEGQCRGRRSVEEESWRGRGSRRRKGCVADLCASDDVQGTDDPNLYIEWPFNSANYTAEMNARFLKWLSQEEVNSALLIKWRESYAY